MLRVSKTGKACVAAALLLSLAACSPIAAPEPREAPEPAQTSPSAQAGESDTGSTLVWSDEFDGPAGAPADPDNWTHETGGGGWGNDELQYYTDGTDNAALDGDGHLVITARQIDPATTDLQCWYGPCTHTSARLISQHKQEFQYGRIEARVRVPEGSGIWPAVWMLGTDITEVGWPQTGEIDIMEFVGRSPNEIFGTLHGPGYSGGQAYSGVRDLGRPVPGEWHEFAMEWSPGEHRLVGRRHRVPSGDARGCRPERVGVRASVLLHHQRRRRRQLRRRPRRRPAVPPGVHDRLHPGLRGIGVAGPARATSGRFTERDRFPVPSRM